MSPVSDEQLAKSRHRYTHPVTKERLIGVTSIVGNWDDGDKLRAGAGAAVKLTRLGIDYRAEWNAKRDLGSRVHENVGDWALGKGTDVLPSDEPYLDAFSKFCQTMHPEWIATERAVVHSIGYGGRFDLVGELKGVPTLLDVKTGKPYAVELTLQLAAYRNAEGMIRYDDKGMAAGLEPMPYIQSVAGLYLDANGHATLVEVEADERAFLAFKCLLATRLWADQVKKEHA